MKRVVAAAFSVFLLAVVAYAGPFGSGGAGGAVSHNQRAATDWSFGSVSIGVAGQLRSTGSGDFEFSNNAGSTWQQIGLGGGMTWPSAAGIASYSGSSSWGASYSSLNQIPFSLLSVTPSNLGLVIGTNVEAWSAVLDSFKGVNPLTGYLYWNGSTFVYQSPAAYTFSNSLVSSSGTVTLSGDSASPGNSMYYGTNSSGAKGWNLLTNQSGSAGQFASVSVGSNLSGSTETPVAQWYCTDSASNTVMCGEITLQMTSNTSGSLTTVLRRYDLVSGTVTNLDVASTQTVASGTATLGATAISSGACASVVSVAATGVLATDAISWSFNAAPPGGYNGTGGILDIRPYVSGGNVNFLVCNPTASSITPGAATLNWRVPR